MNAFELFAEIQDELKVVEARLGEIVKDPDQLLSTTSSHLLMAGGKRLRPAFALLAAKIREECLEQAISIAVAMELIHMASLVHDDVVDASVTRRGMPTVKAMWGNKVSMHTGDHIFAKSLILISEYADPRIAQVLSQTSVQMSEGEVQQIISSFDPQQTIKDYFYRIKRKTALLISASCRCGAIAVGASDTYVSALTRYGHYLGMAFQITDDILDLVADEEELGKPIGGDLRQGIITLPIIFALQSPEQREALLQIIPKRDKTEDEVTQAIQLIKDSGAIGYSFDMSDRFIKKALAQLDLLPQVPVVDTFRLIAGYINLRRY
ncbi:MAG TPA: polyprenyl synthetase family protein [Bacillota bacterium]|nr:polyprenyl synthetase family protein [Bacillota bacterium]